MVLESEDAEHDQSCCYSACGVGAKSGFSVTSVLRIKGEILYHEGGVREMWFCSRVTDVGIGEE